MQKYFTGKQCSRGHIALRFPVSHCCVECERERDRGRNKGRIKSKRAAIQDWLWELKANLACERCGFSHPAAIQFHHPNKNKTATVARLAHGSKDKALAEIQKCMALCANCHAIEHHPRSRRPGAA